MIVDCHTHLWSRAHWTEEAQEDALRVIKNPCLLETTAEQHWQAMQPVDKAVVFGFSARHTGLVVPNDFVANYVRKHPDKLIGFVAIDPNEPGYLDELRRGIEDLKFRGVKLAPIYQNYHVMDGRMLPVYDYCEKNGLPILIHQGTTFFSKAPLKYALPVQLEDVAMRYPDLVMVIAHMGHPWIDETVVLIRKQPNFYADVSALYYRPWQFYNALISAVEYGAAHKLLFGSDFPFTEPGVSAEAIRNANHVAGNSGLPQVPAEVLDGIVERDTLQLLNLS
jgi:predicted TIM-barrel fold metal-dependent hydrolase